MSEKYSPDLSHGLVDVETLSNHYSEPGWRVVDCRFDLMNPDAGEQEWLQGHIPGAAYAHLDRVLSSPVTPRSGRHPLPDLPAFVDWLGQQGIDEHTRVVAYDDSLSMYAARLWWLLHMLGHEQVAVLDGGWSAWRQAGLPVDAEPSRPEARVYRPRNPIRRFEEAAVVDAQAVERNIGHGDFLLVDVRTAERYRGEAEPIDPVAGHVPGSVNLPLTENVDERGFFHSPKALRELYAPLYQSHPPERQAYLCGSGVSACQPLLAQHAAGLGLPLLYAGSWSEWIRDPNRPVAIGEQP